MMEFKRRLCYRNQSRDHETGHVCHSSLWACLVQYPGALHPTPVRVKIDTAEIPAQSSTIEFACVIQKWGTDGWVWLDEFLTTDFVSVIEAEENSLLKAGSFLMGVPIKMVYLSDDDKPPQAPVKRPRPRPTKKMSSKETKKSDIDKNKLNDDEFSYI
tara:strand:- start:107 stop:580 length:474 start_codon:yes stop_codon:yes gene_type:complete